MKPQRRAIPVKSSRVKKTETVLYPNDFEERDTDGVFKEKRRHMIRQGTVAPRTPKEFDGLGHEEY